MLWKGERRHRRAIAGWMASRYAIRRLKNRLVYPFGSSPNLSTIPALSGLGILRPAGALSSCAGFIPPDRILTVLRLPRIANHGSASVGYAGSNQPDNHPYLCCLTGTWVSSAAPPAWRRMGVAINNRRFGADAIFV